MEISIKDLIKAILNEVDGYSKVYPEYPVDKRVEKILLELLPYLLLEGHFIDSLPIPKEFINSK
jgi:hypothetical protein